MKLQVSNTNAPAWRDLTIKSDLPSKLKHLETLAKNLWWVWNSDAKSLCRDLNPDLWRSTGENPVMLLQQLSSERLDEILADADLMGMPIRVVVSPRGLQNDEIEVTDRATLSADKVKYEDALSYIDAMMARKYEELK